MSAKPVNPVLRELPHNLDLERAVLAVLLDGRHATSMARTRERIAHPLVFFQRDHQIVYLACLELDDQGTRPDAQAVAELLSRYRFDALIDRLREQQTLLDSDHLDGMARKSLRAIYGKRDTDDTASFSDSVLNAIGGFNTVSDLSMAFAPAASLDRNVDLLYDYYLKRRTILSLSAIVDQTYITTENNAQILDRASRSVLALGRSTGASELFEIGSVFDETMEQYHQQKDQPNIGVQTGMPDIDQKLISLRPGGLYVLAARPGVGKTSLALKIVSHVAGDGDGQPVLFFSLEVDRHDLVKKLISSEAHVPFRSLEPGGILDEAELKRVELVSQDFHRWPIKLMDVSDLTIHSLRSRVRREIMESNGRLKLVVIDYLQLLGSSKKDATEYEKITEISRVLKVLARESSIPILALSQMSRDSEKGVSETRRDPRLSDLRGSGSIEQDSDAVIFIHRVDSNEGGGDRTIKVIVAKNRFGETGHCLMTFKPATMSFGPACVEGVPTEPGYGEYQQTRAERSGSKPHPNEDLFK